MTSASSIHPFQAVPLYKNLYLPSFHSLLLTTTNEQTNNQPTNQQAISTLNLEQAKKSKCHPSPTPALALPTPAPIAAIALNAAVTCANAL
jgi:hypothetical protein